MLDIQLDEADSYTVCRPVGELDAYTVGQFRESLADLAGAPRLLIDLSSVPFMDSAGLGALIGGVMLIGAVPATSARPHRSPTPTRQAHRGARTRVLADAAGWNEVVRRLQREVSRYWR